MQTPRQEFPVEKVQVPGTVSIRSDSKPRCRACVMKHDQPLKVALNYDLHVKQSERQHTQKTFQAGKTMKHTCLFPPASAEVQNRACKILLFGLFPSCFVMTFIKPVIHDHH